MSEEIRELNDVEAVQAAIGLITLLATQGYVHPVSGVDYAQWIAELLLVIERLVADGDS